MRSPKSKFRLLDRRFADTLVLVPGWATEHRIFSNLDLSYNYLVPLEFNPFSFEKELSQAINMNSLDKVSLLGWSMGGFLVADFASRYPDRIKELILIGMRERFGIQEIEEAREGIKKSRKAYLYKFYHNCFSKTDREGLGWFKKNLLSQYIDKMDLGRLLSGLDYLSRACLSSKSLTRIKRIRIFHGSDDKIVCLREALSIKSSLPQAEFVILKGLGHIPFLNPQFRRRFYGR